MKNIFFSDFLLSNEMGKKFYHEVAKDLPIIDFHNHIDPSSLASNTNFENIYQLWIQNDPYKHRTMRIYGIPEQMITGNGSDYDKFLSWADCMTHTIGNPLFHWSCMELKFLFGIEDILNLQNALQIWNTANSLLIGNDFRAIDLMKRFGVEMLCTSDDLLDNLENHILLSAQQNEITCLPSLRGDSIVSFNQPEFFSWLDKLQKVTNINITELSSYKTAILARLDFFDEQGCLLSDHSLDSGFHFVPTNIQDANQIFENFLKEKKLTDEDLIRLRSHLLSFLGEEYSRKNWKMQLHLGAYRFTSTRLRDLVGPAGGYACIGNIADIQSLCMFLDQLDIKNNLPKTILYTLNPADNAVFASITGSFSEDGVQGKIQYGPAWWFNDHYEGITQQLNALSSYGLLSTSIGMTTDSRSLLSFIRHDYYRRIICNMLGAWVEEGKLPDDWELISNTVKNISYNNIKNWLKK